MMVKKDRLMEEVGKLKEDVRRMAGQHDSLLKELVEAKDLLNKSPLPPAPPKSLQSPQPPPERAGSLVC
jgi:hypothetical protein